MIHNMPHLLIWKALEFFIENPYKEIYVREFSKKLKISPNTAQRFLNLFLKEALITEERKAHMRYFKANIDNIVFRQIKKTYSIKIIKDSGILEMLKDSCTSVVLFGSVAKGLDDKQSDIDIVCIAPLKNIPLGRIQEKLSKQLNIHIFTMAEWKKQKKINKAFYQDVIADGINLIGEMPLVD